MNITVLYKKTNFFSLTKSLILNKNLNFGPDIVAKNLIQGLKQKGIYIVVNKIANKKNQIFIVLSGLDNLERAIRQKKENSNCKIYAGPNITVIPKNKKDLLFSKYVDKIVVPSSWIKKKYLKKTSLKFEKKICIWPIGIDHKYWVPARKEKKIYDFLVYKKFIYDKKIFERCVSYLNKKEYKIKIIKYGEYSKKNYLKYLQQTKYMIFFSQSESQGLSLFESWSCNIPTFIYDQKYWIYKKTKYLSSSAPYLSKDTGVSFKNFKEFKNKIELFQKNKYSPRKWINKNATIKISVDKLLKI